MHTKRFSCFLPFSILNDKQISLRIIICYLCFCSLSISHIFAHLRQFLSHFPLLFNIPFAFLFTRFDVLLLYCSDGENKCYKIFLRMTRRLKYIYTCIKISIHKCTSVFCLHIIYLLVNWNWLWLNTDKSDSLPQHITL